MKEDLLISLLQKLNKEIAGLKAALAASKPVYTNEELRALLGVSDKTIKKWRTSGMLGYSLIGDTYLYSKEDVERFLTDIHHSPQVFTIRR
jgi:excisionase family DNA binding protein